MNTDKNVDAIYEILKAGISDEELTQLVNKAQQKIIEDKKAEDERKKKIQTVEILRADVITTIIDYYRALGVQFDEETEIAIYDRTAKWLEEEEKKYPLFNKNIDKKVNVTNITNEDTWKDFIDSYKVWLQFLKKI